MEGSRLGPVGLAQQYYLYSFQLAAQADPRAHAAYALRILAHQAMDLGRHEHCVELADAALARAKGRVDADTESLFWLTATRAHAADGNSREALVALSTAERLIGRAGGDAGPEWAALGGPAEARLASQAGKALQAMGDLPQAQEQFRRSARCWDPVTHPRIYALTLANLAETQCAQGNVEQVCQTWHQALDGMAGIRSARTREAVRSMRAHLAVYRGRGLAAPGGWRPGPAISADNRQIVGCRMWTVMEDERARPAVRHGVVRVPQSGKCGGSPALRRRP